MSEVIDGLIHCQKQAIRPQGAEKVGWHRRAGKVPEAAKEMSPPVAHLLMHQKLADLLLLEE